ncbi:hypothetical protein [Paenibacillus sp. A14]|uniref:hypothetical protein n=1 Tax=Paenibacillus sp. A14 TaxID=3119820 RepID=UPI002FE094F1
MIYLRACEEPELGTYYFEVDSDGIALRQIVIEEDGTRISSHRKHEHYHFMLAERPIDLSDAYYERIPQARFEGLWSEILLATLEEWRQVKQALPVGMKITGSIEAFFPQGTLVDMFEDRAVGLADTASLRKISPPEWMYPGHKLEAIVKGYDEVNQWVLLNQARMLDGERR